MRVFWGIEFPTRPKRGPARIIDSRTWQMGRIWCESWRALPAIDEKGGKQIRVLFRADLALRLGERDQSRNISVPELDSLGNLRCESGWERGTLQHAHAIRTAPPRTYEGNGTFPGVQRNSNQGKNLLDKSCPIR
jgi:hypothetical protein